MAYTSRGGDAHHGNNFQIAEESLLSRACEFYVCSARWTGVYMYSYSVSPGYKNAVWRLRRSFFLGNQCWAKRLREFFEMFDVEYSAAITEVTCHVDQCRPGGPVDLRFAKEQCTIQEN